MSEPTKSTGGEPAGEDQAKAQCASFGWRFEFGLTMPVSYNRDFFPAFLILLAGILVYLMAGLTIGNSKVTGYILCVTAILMVVGGLGRLMWLCVRQGLAVIMPFRPFCPHCGKHVASDVQWKCGFCDKKNTNTRRFSFLNKCEHCDAAPKAYLCHNCGETIFLDEHENAKHCARIFVEPTREEVKPIAELKSEQIKLKKLDIMIAQMDTELALAKQTLRGVQLQRKELGLSKHDRLQESYDEHEALHTKIHEIAAKQEREAREKYSGNPQMLELKLQSIRDWVAKQLGSME